MAGRGTEDRTRRRTPEAAQHRRRAATGQKRCSTSDAMQKAERDIARSGAIQHPGRHTARQTPESMFYSAKHVERGAECRGTIQRAADETAGRERRNTTGRDGPGRTPCTRPGRRFTADVTHRAERDAARRTRCSTPDAMQQAGRRCSRPGGGAEDPTPHGSRNAVEEATLNSRSDAA